MKRGKRGKTPTRSDRLREIAIKAAIFDRVLGGDPDKAWLLGEVRRGDRLAAAVEAAFRDHPTGPTKVGDYIRSREAFVDAVRRALDDWRAGT